MNEGNDLKIADFGQSVQLKEKEKDHVKKEYGTPLYACPGNSKIKIRII